MAFKSNLLFSVLNNILVDKSIEVYNSHVNNELEWKTVSKFIVLKYLSMSNNENVRNIVLDNYETLERMPEKILYKVLMMKVPKQRSGFIKFIK